MVLRLVSKLWKYYAWSGSYVDQVGLLCFSCITDRNCNQYSLAPSAVSAAMVASDDHPSGPVATAEEETNTHHMPQVN